MLFLLGIISKTTPCYIQFRPILFSPAFAFSMTPIGGKLAPVETQCDVNVVVSLAILEKKTSLLHGLMGWAEDDTSTTITDGLIRWQIMLGLVVLSE